MASDETLEHCVQAFVNRDYGSCAQQALNTLSTGASHELLQLLLISLQRLDQKELLAQLEPKVLAATADDPWRHALLSLTLGQADPAQLFGQANDDLQRCQVFFYSGARLLTLGQTDGAQKMFDACIAVESDCLEHRLACAEQVSLTPAHPRPPVSRSADPGREAAEAIREALDRWLVGKPAEACIRAFAAGDYTACAEGYLALLSTGLNYQDAQLLLISLQRRGRTELVDRLGSDILANCPPEPWACPLLQLTLGRADPAALLEQAESDLERCKVLFYWGAQLLTNGRADEAKDPLRACVSLDVLCLERLLAQLELLMASPNDWRPARPGNDPVSRSSEEPPPAQPETPPSREQACRDCFEAFLDRNYRRCAEQALGLGSSAVPTVIAHCLLISLQHLGETAALAKLGPRFVAATEQAWDRLLLQVILGQADAAEVWSAAANEVQRCQALYWEGVRLLAVGQPEAARSALTACLETQADCPEHSLAQRELDKGLPAPPPPSASSTAGPITHLLDRARESYEEGRYPEALELAGQARDLARQQHGEDHPDYGASLMSLAMAHSALGHLEAAELLYRQLLDFTRRAFGSGHPGTVMVLQVLADVYRRRDNLAAVEPLCEEILAIVRGMHEECHPDVTNARDDLASVCLGTGNYARAEHLLLQTLEILRASLGEEHPDVGTGLSNLGLAHLKAGNPAAAEPLLRRALQVLDRPGASKEQDRVNALHGLSELLRLRGEYAATEALLREALHTMRAVQAENPRGVAGCLNNLADFYRSNLRTPAQAFPLYEEAMKIMRASGLERDPIHATVLSNMTLVLADLGAYSEAESWGGQVVDLRRRILGDEHPDYAKSLNILGVVCRKMGDLARAESLLAQALEIRRRILGATHLDCATSLNNLACLYEARGEYSRAEAHYREALQVRQTIVGEIDPDSAVIVHNLAQVCAATDRFEEALDRMQQAAALEDHLIGQVFSIGSESQRTAFLEETQWKLASFLSLVWAHLAHSPEAVRVALELVLRRKAIAAEVQAAQRDAVLGGKYPHLQPQLQQWSALRLQIARKTLDGPGPEGPQPHQRQLAGWHTQRERLEAELARQIPEMNLEKTLRAAGCRAVALTLPANVTLVEFVRFDIYNFKAVPTLGERHWQPARYLAFLLPARDPDGLRMIDLGEAEPIDRMIELFRAGVTEAPQARNMVRRPATASPLSQEQAGQQLRAAVFDPLTAALGECRQLLLSPDGALTRLPFAVLPDAEGRLLMHSYQVSYVNAGRDVLRFGAASSGVPAAALVVTDPDFDLAPTGAAEPLATGRGSKLSRDLPRDRYHFDRLPGTRSEGERIAALLGVQPWQDGSALEGRLKRECRSPRILHLATHGFFLEDQKHDPNQEQRGLGLAGEMGRLSGPLPENPLLRSGLALAGANTWLRGGAPPEEAEDGLLTAEDVSGLDLLATELVVLSACETGLGEVRTGEGVFGLQRAFTLAGAKTLVMSLWSVPDDATRELMEDFYTRILAGEGRADALRNAQLALRAMYPDPYYWGAFICQGDPAPLRGPARPTAESAT